MTGHANGSTSWFSARCGTEIAQTEKKPGSPIEKIIESGDKELVKLKFQFKKILTCISILNHPQVNKDDEKLIVPPRVNHHLCETTGQSRSIQSSGAMLEIGT